MSDATNPNPGGPVEDEDYIEMEEEGEPLGDEFEAHARATHINTTYNMKYQDTVALVFVNGAAWLLSSTEAVTTSALNAIAALDEASAPWASSAQANLCVRAWRAL